MKICHVTCVHPRYDIRILEKECVSLAKEGYETYLVVNDDEPDEIKKGIQIISTGFKPSNRVERMIKSVNKVFSKAIEIDADIYHLHDPELLRISDKLIKKGKKVIFDAHEDTEEQIKDKSWIPLGLRGIVAKTYGCYAYSKMKRLNGVITVTPSIVEKYKKYNNNIAMVTNYPILSEQENVDRSLVNANKEKYVFFAGGISTQWCHENIAKAVGKLDEIKYLFAGRHATDEYIKKVCSQDSANYLGLLSHDAVMEYYHGAIAGMAILKCTQVGIDGTLGNTKLFEVMQAGKPVICSDLRLWREIVEKYNCGICVNSDNVEEIAEAINFLVQHPAEAKKMGENGKRAVAEKFNWENQAKILLDFYNSICK